MARIVLAPLVSDISGKTCGVVFSRWKGRNYVRKLVIPTNPKSDLQMAVRDSLARLVYLYRTLEAQIQDWQNECAADDRMSGYNLFMKMCRAREQAEDLLLITPFNTKIAHASSFEAVTGTVAEGDVTLNWTGGTESADHKAYILAREVIDPKGVGYELWDEGFIVAEADTTLFSAKTVTVTLPKGDTEYEVYLINEEGTAGKFSMSMGATATSYAGA